MGETLKLIAAIGAALSGVTLIVLAAFLKARLKTIVGRKSLPAIGAAVEDLALTRKVADGVVACELAVRCSHAGDTIRLIFRIEAADEEAARANQRYLALTRILRVGQPVKLRFKPGMKYLGYFLDEDVYPQAEPEMVVRGLQHFRFIAVVGGLFVAAAILILLLLL